MDHSCNSLQNRDLRQREIIPPDRLASCHAFVIGVGAIGRQVALQLAAVGIPRLTLIDHDQVAVENLAAQGYWPSDLGRPKVECTGKLCRQIHPDISVTVWAERFRASRLRRIGADERLSVFACVDSITTRGAIFEAVRSKAALYVDGRMNAEVLRVVAISRPATDSYYSRTLFDSSEAVSGSCTARSTIYTASISAGMMIGQFTKWLRGLPIERDVTLNLLSLELSTGEAVGP
jgi:sulfur carrier protein ThiS adenylyltransferase